MQSLTSYTPKQQAYLDKIREIETDEDDQIYDDLDILWWDMSQEERDQLDIELFNSDDFKNFFFG